MNDTEFKVGEIMIYKTPDGPEIQVRLEEDTVWLTQKQMTLLFDKGLSTINEHISNVFKEGELDENSTIRKFRIVQKEGNRLIERELTFYNLDVIISVGYRVKSLRGTQFRIWATKVLKEHLVKGYTINKQRLLQAENYLNDLQETIAWLQEKTNQKQLVGQEKEIMSLLANYAKTLTLLTQYDNEKLKMTGKAKGDFVITYRIAKNVIRELKKDLINRNEASELFGRENDNKLQAILNNLYQTFDGKELYHSLEEKASHLLYFIIKDHPFIDGNKRIASFLFVYFLDKNNYLLKPSGEKKINDNALTVLSLLIAVSDPKEKDKFIRLITNLLVT